MEWDEVKDAFKRQIPVYYNRAGYSRAGDKPIECVRIAEYGFRADEDGNFHRFVGAIGAAAFCLYRGTPEEFSLSSERAEKCNTTAT